MAIKVGDWVVVQGLSEYKDFEEGEVKGIHGSLADVYAERIGANWSINVKYLRKVRKEISKDEYIDAALDLRNKDWFMTLTSEVGKGD